MTAPRDPAELAYAAYGRYASGQTYDGKPLPTFEQLSPATQGAWMAAATAGGSAGTPATQTRHPWRAVVRTIVAAVIAGLPVVVDIVAGLDLGATVVGAQVLLVAGAVTRVLAMPGVEAWLTTYIPWLAAKPRE